MWRTESFHRFFHKMRSALHMEAAVVFNTFATGDSVEGTVLAELD